LPSADLAESDDALIERLLGQLSIVPIAFGKPEPLSSVQGDITQVTFTVPFTSAPNAFDYKLTQYIHQGMDKELGDRLDGLSNG